MMTYTFLCICPFGDLIQRILCFCILLIFPLQYSFLSRIQLYSNPSLILILLSSELHLFHSNVFLLSLRILMDHLKHQYMKILFFSIDFKFSSVIHLKFCLCLKLYSFSHWIFFQ